MSAFACVVVPYFVAAAVERVEPALRDRAFAVITGAAPSTRIVEANTVARAMGVHPPMTEGEARTRCPELTTRTLADEVQATACYALLDAALAVSPRVEDAGPGLVHLDVTGLDRLIGDAATVGRRLLREVRAMGFAATAGLGESRATARIAARLGRAVTVVEAGRERAVLGTAPIAVLDPDADSAATCARWGVRTLTDLAALPRAGVAARLGVAGLRLHDLASGLDRAPFRAYTPPPFYQEAQGVDWEIDRLDPLVAVLTPLLERLCARLRAGHLAADVLDVDLRLASGNRHQRRVSLAHPLVDAGAMAPLVRLDLEAHPPGAAVTGVAITAHPVRVRAGQGGLWRPTMPAIRELASVLTRLATLVGPAAVGAPALDQSHRPDPVTMRAFEVGEPSASATGASVAASAGASQLVLRRLRPPRTVDVECERHALVAVRWNGVRYPVDGCAGPWRRSGDWWDVGGWARDEWDVALADGTLCRLAHDPRTGTWLLDAVYD